MSLSQPKRLALLQLMKMPGWEALLDVMEEECIKAETEHFRTPPDDTQKVLTGHYTCTAMRKFFERVQKSVLFETNEALKPEPEPEPDIESVEAITGLI